MTSSYLLVYKKKQVMKAGEKAKEKEYIFQTKQATIHKKKKGFVIFCIIFLTHPDNSYTTLVTQLTHK